MLQIVYADDNKTIRTIMDENLKSLNYEYLLLDSGTAVEEMIGKNEYPPLMILDWEMPGKSGPELCQMIKKKQKEENRFTYVILCTTRDSTEDIIHGFETGADDYISKPFNLAELKARIKVGFRTLDYQQQLKEKEFNIRMNCYQALTELAETHCLETSSHLKRIAKTSSMLAQWHGESLEFQRDMSLFSPMHDIGKVSVPESLLYLPRKLTIDEFNLIKNHTLQGWKILKDKSTLEMAAEIALTHHEHWDGTGYPQKLEGKNIPLCGRITTLCDVYDTLRSKRSYKEAWDHQKTMDFILQESEKTFDPHLIEILKKEQDQWADLYGSEPVESISIEDII